MTATQPATPSQHAGRVALITGGSGGIGGAIAARLRSEGAVVHVVDVDPPSAGDDTAVDGAFHRADVASEPEMRAVVETVAQREGRIDYLVTTAAVFVSRPFLDLSLEEWTRTLAINTTGSFLACRLVLDGMLRRRFGRMVLFSSMLARTGGVNCAAYATSKGGVLGLARTLALEVAADGVRVNTLSPGLTDTAQPRGHLSEEQLAVKGRAIPLGRIAAVPEVVDGAMFLLGDESSFYTGQDLRIAGGHGLW